MAFPYDLFQGLTAPKTISPYDTRDLLDYQGTNTVMSARYINPITKDFEVSSTDHFVGMNAVEQSVLLALNTTFGTSAQPGFGQNFLSPKFITSTQQIQNKMTALVTQCLSFPINNGQISLISVLVVNNGNGQVAVQISYTNNTLPPNNQTQLSFIIP